MFNKSQSFVITVIGGLLALVFLPQFFNSLLVIFGIFTGKLAGASSFEAGRLIGNATVGIIVYILIVVMLIKGVRGLAKRSQK